MDVSKEREEKIRETLAVLEGEKLICPDCSKCIRFQKGKLVKHLDSKKWYDYAYSSELEKLKELYVTNKAYLNCRSCDSTALHAASFGGHLEVVNWLVGEGANVNATLDGNWNWNSTPLRIVAHHGHLEIVKILISNGAHLHLRGIKFQGTALHDASYAGQIEVIQYLLAEGADIKIPDNSFGYFTPRQLAKNDEVRQVFDLFRPSLVQICIQTLYRAHNDEEGNFSLSQKQLDCLPKHLNRKLIPYITV